MGTSIDLFGQLTKEFEETLWAADSHKKLLPISPNLAIKNCLRRLRYPKARQAKARLVKVRLAKLRQARAKQARLKQAKLRQARLQHLRVYQMSLISKATRMVWTELA